MKRILKIIISVTVTAYLSLSMFYCFVAGAPAQKDALNIYILGAAGFSIVLPAFACVCIHYILHLQKKLAESQDKH